MNPIDELLVVLVDKVVMKMVPIETHMIETYEFNSLYL